MKAARYSNPVPQYTDSSGELLSGGKLFFYVAGTTTKKDTYTTSAKSVANANPLILNSRGEASTDIYLDGSYKVVLSPSTDTDPPTNAIWTRDNVTSLSALAGAIIAKTGNYTVVESDSDSLVTVDATSGNVTIALTAAATLGNGFEITIRKIDSSTNTVTIDPDSSETINGFSTLVLSDKFDCVQLVCDGSNWVTKCDQRLLVKDPNNNTLWENNYVTSAVNYLTYSNNSTGNKVLLSCSGSDTNISLNLATKGSGAVEVSQDDSSTNTTLGTLKLYRSSTGTAAASIGTAVEAYLENANGTSFLSGKLAFVATDVTNAAEHSTANLSLIRAGAAITPFIFSHAGSNTATLKQKLPSSGDLYLDPVVLDTVRTTNQTVSTGTVTTIVCATETYDNYTYHDTGTGLFTPLVPGYYFVHGNVRYSSTTLKTVTAYIYKNSSSVAINSQALGAVSLSVPVCAVVYCNGSTDTISLRTVHDAGSDQTVDGASSNSTKLSIIHLPSA